MSRHHGWQLPANPLQIAAITLYFMLCEIFYGFLSPFLGKDLYQYIAIGVYSFLALSVLILYARCATIDPADPGILITVNGALIYKSEELRNSEENQTHKSCLGAGSVCCAIFMKDDCGREGEAYQQEDYGEDVLFCILCNTEVRKNSKHCRSCNKCVDGFVHHSRCLNNCVGRKNHTTFLCLMAVSLLWLAVECGVGIAVLVRYFTDKTAIEDEIREKLGYSIISQEIFAVMLALGTSLSMFASVPLGKLFFFHMLLIRKGSTTYEYVVARRAQSEPPILPVNDDQQSISSSPMSSAPTAFSGSSFAEQRTAREQSRGRPERGEQSRAERLPPPVTKMLQVANSLPFWTQTTTEQQNML